MDITWKQVCRETVIVKNEGVISMDEPIISKRLKEFAINYAGTKCGNAEQAAIAAGYSPSYARGNAHKLLARMDVRAYLKYLSTVNPSKSLLDREDILKFWGDIILNNKEVTKDRIKASELYAKAIGMFDQW